MSAPTLLGPPDQIQAAAGTLGAAAVYSITPMGGPGGPPPGPPGSAPATAPPGSGKEAAPANVDAKYDPLTVLFATKPASVQELIRRMGELLYGEPAPAAARAKIEKFLLDGKKTIASKDMESKEFKQRAREALHALMCLPDYQLN